MEFERLLGKDNPMLESIKSRGFETPTEIQEKSIPDILKGNDVIAGASTGSGKTLAFAAGLIKNVKKDFGIQGLVLTPTRELAEQIANELAYFSSDKNLNVISIYGGMAINPQIKRMISAEIVVGTPGRVLDHIDRNSINLSHVNTLILDEADRMLDMGFIDDVEKIIAECPNKRQTLLFSATISPDIAHLAKRHMKEIVEISAKPYVDPTKLEQVYYDVSDNLKYSLLKHLLENEKAKLVMIFCNTRRNVDFIANNLKFMGIETVPIHGGFTQDKRNRMLHSFHSGKVHVLVATDVAARGLDIKGVSHVYNYDIPPTKNEYIHRIGRTARAGKQGKAINILASRDYENFQNIITGEFNLIKGEVPYLKRAKIRWMPEKKHERMRRDFSQNKRRFDYNKSGHSFNNKSGSKYGSKSSDNKFSNGFGNRNRKFGNQNRRSGDRFRNQRGSDRFGRKKFRNFR